MLSYSCRLHELIVADNGNDTIIYIDSQRTIYFSFVARNKLYITKRSQATKAFFLLREKKNFKYSILNTTKVCTANYFY